MIDASIVKIPKITGYNYGKVIEISLIPSIEYRTQSSNRGFINAIYAQDSGSISIDQNTPPT